MAKRSRRAGGGDSAPRSGNAQKSCIIPRRQHGRRLTDAQKVQFALTGELVIEVSEDHWDHPIRVTLRRISDDMYQYSYTGSSSNLRASTVRDLAKHGSAQWLWQPLVQLIPHEE